VGGGRAKAEEAASRFGLPVDLIQEADGMDFRGAEDGIYPDNMRVYTLFRDMLTQWRTGPGGIIGLDYNVLFRYGIEYESEEFEGIRIMERVALTELRRDS